MKTLVLAVTLAAAAVATTPLRADPGHRHGQNAAATQNCPAHGTQGAQNAQGGHGRMAQRGEHGGGHHGMHGGRGHRGSGAHQDGHGAQQGNASAGCPMHPMHEKHQGAKPT